MAESAGSVAAVQPQESTENLGQHPSQTQDHSPSSSARKAFSFVSQKPSEKLEVFWK